MIEGFPNRLHAMPFQQFLAELLRLFRRHYKGQVVSRGVCGLKHHSSVEFKDTPHSLYIECHLPRAHESKHLPDASHSALKLFSELFKGHNQSSLLCLNDTILIDTEAAHPDANGLGILLILFAPSNEAIDNVFENIAPSVAQHVRSPAHILLSIDDIYVCSTQLTIAWTNRLRRSRAANDFRLYIAHSCLLIATSLGDFLRKRR
mmetsp:Transcript_116741/g.206529  ORF Transcript_116741/g.206529 Transcript_116741/m.206529 type:complete len:205 (-) Transcript_116741:457-1071(-)